MRCRCRDADTFRGDALGGLLDHLVHERPDTPPGITPAWSDHRCPRTGARWYVHRPITAPDELEGWRYPDVRERDLRTPVFIARAAATWQTVYRNGSRRERFDAQETLYSRTFLDYVTRLQHGDADPEAAIVFLEIDPWVPWSGYHKQRLLRFVSRVTLTDSHRARLHDVVVETTRKGPRREFRETTLLAKRIWTADFEARLHALAAADERLAAPVEQLIRKRYTR